MEIGVLGAWMFEKLQGALRPLIYLSSNWISLLGVVLVTTGGILWVFLLPSLIRGSAKDPYLGILQFMVLPPSSSPASD